MTRDEALAIVLDIASRWGENQEEGFARRVMSSDTDEACAENADASGWETDDVIEVRELWKAIELLTGEKA